MESENLSPSLVSVVLPVFNGEKHVAEAMESLLAQTWQTLEVIAIDDGSTDSSGTILEAFAQRDERVRAIRHSNRGLVAALNEGIEEARGEYVARMDADDIASPTRIERQVTYLQESPDCLAVSCSVLWVDPDGDPLRPMAAAPSHKEITEILLRGRGGLCHPGVVFRRDAAAMVGGYRSEFEHAEDVDFFLRLGECGRLANLEEILLKYRQHFDSVCAKHHAAQRQSAQAAVTQACLRRQLAPRDTTCFYPPVRTEAEIHRYWSYLAKEAGYMKTARKHGVLAVKKSPLSIRAWRHLLLALKPSASRCDGASVCPMA